MKNILVLGELLGTYKDGSKKFGASGDLEMEIAPGTNILELDPQRLFRASRFRVNADCAASFGLVNVFVGSRAQRPTGLPLQQDDPISCLVFALEDGVEVLWDTVQPPLRMQFAIKNITNKTQVFRGKIWGQVIVEAQK